MAAQMYVQDYDEHLFFRATRPGQATISRTGAVSSDLPGYYSELWWNVIRPYIKNTQVLVCPSDASPVLSQDPTGASTIKRSYIAIRAAEGLALPQLEFPAETIILTDKWDKTVQGESITDSWIEPMNGDFDYYPTYHRMALAGDRHQEGLNSAFFDGHAKWLKGQTIGASKNLTGCTLINSYPVLDMCDKGDPGCTNTGIADNTDPNHPIADRNICDTFSWP